MKKGVLNYSVVYIENDERKEEIFITKLSAINNYIGLLYSHKNISSLTVYEIYKKPGKNPENITGKINNFLNN